MDVSRSASNASAGMLSGSDAFPFFSFSIAFLISFLLGLSILIGRGVSAGGVSGGSSGTGQLSFNRLSVWPLLSALMRLFISL